MVNEIIKGDSSFLNFIITTFDELQENGNILSNLTQNHLDGFIIKNILSEQEVESVLEQLSGVANENKFTVPTGEIFPKPFASITDDQEQLSDYIYKANILNQQTESTPFQNLLNKLDSTLKLVSNPLNVQVPFTKTTQSKCAPGNFRIFKVAQGGLYVHCGYLFQEKAPFYYTVVEPMKLDGQMSYFILLQNAESGGELTLYDVFWENVKKKLDDSDNRYLVDDNGNQIDLDKVKKCHMRPGVGDLLVFRGGPIWHRVEEIIGNKPRITFGGFINISEDEKGLRYWG